MTKTTTTKKTAPPAEESGRDLEIALELKALYRVAPARARAKILAAFKRTGGNAVHAAERLGIGHRTILRYMGEDPELEKAIEKIRREEREAREKDRASS